MLDGDGLQLLSIQSFIKSKPYSTMTKCRQILVYHAMKVIPIVRLGLHHSSKRDDLIGLGIFLYYDHQKNLSILCYFLLKETSLLVKTPFVLEVDNITTPKIQDLSISS